MPVTRDKNFPAEAAALVDAFSRCCEGHDIVHVVQAAANFLTMSIHAWAKARRFSLPTAESRARMLCKELVADLATQWNRIPKPTDVAVNRN